MNATPAQTTLPLLPRPEEAREARRVVLIPPALARELAAERRRPAQRQARPRPTPAPPSAQKDRISIGPPSTERAKELILRREDDLTATPKGQPDASGPKAAQPTPEPVAEPRTAEARPGTGSPALGTPGWALPVSPTGRSASGAGGLQGSRQPSIAASVRRWEDRLRSGADVGLPTGTGKQMGPLFFDPQGADFTAWINHFKNEVYRNWVVPQSALMGLGGRVDMRFVVARDGRMTELTLVSGSGTDALDRAAGNALRGSQFRPLPDDFGPQQVIMNVSFFYNQRPPSS